MRNIVGNGNGRRKSKSEARAYRQSIKSNTTPLESTVDLRNNNLSGSAEANNIAFLDSSTQSAKISFRLRAKRFFKTHIFESVLGALMAIIVALAGWYAKTLIDLKIDYAVFESRLSSIEERIDELDADNITREILELQLNALKQELLSGSTLQAANLSNRIDLLERQIELLQ